MGASSFEGWVHDHLGGEHCSRELGMELEKELRTYIWSTNTTQTHTHKHTHCGGLLGMVWAFETVKSTPSDSSSNQSHFLILPKQIHQLETKRSNIRGRLFRRGDILTQITTLQFYFLKLNSQNQISIRHYMIVSRYFQVSVFAVHLDGLIQFHISTKVSRFLWLLCEMIYMYIHKL